MLAIHLPLRSFLALFVCLILVRASSAQNVTLAPGDPPANRFGSSVSLSGNTAVVGAMSATNEGGPSAGSVYVFVNDGISWTEQAKLIASDAAAGDLFGWSVALFGDTAVVGSRLDSHAGGFEAGSAYVFARSGSVWTEQAKLVASDARTGDRFGSSVAVFGDTIVVGAPGDDGPAGLDAGSAYVFVRLGTTWIQEAKLAAADAGNGDAFGASVALSAETALVGAPGDSSGSNTGAGSGYAFVRSGTLWSQQSKMTGNGDHGDDLGFSVALSGDTAVLGAPGEDDGAVQNAGAVRVFVRTGSTWTQQARLVASNGDGNSLGGSVAISGGTVVAGSPFDSNYHSWAGAAFVFERSGTIWTQQEKLATEDAGIDAHLGSSVALEGDRALLGAPGHAGSSGAAYMWSLPATAPPPVASFTGQPLRGEAPLTVFFSDASTGTITNWVWSFGDGFISTLQNPAYTFLEPGIYSVSLTVSGPDGADFHIEHSHVEVLRNVPWTRRASSP